MHRKLASSRFGDEAGAVAGAREYARANSLPDPRLAYTQQKNGAANRGIEWRLTFASWWDIWKPYFHLRGRGTNGLCMARERDEGPYSPDNVYLTTNLGNLRDYHRKCPRSAQERQQRKEIAETRFARTSAASRADRLSLLSHTTYKTHNTSKSTCNFKDDMPEFRRRASCALKKRKASQIAGPFSLERLVILCVVNGWSKRDGFKELPLPGDNK